MTKRKRSTKLTVKKLTEFGLQHYNYINQIWGDQGIRSLIESEYSRSNLSLKVEYPKPNLAHHVVYDKINNNKICSVDNNYQNDLIDKNNTLCQSYSLLTFMTNNKPIPKSPKTQQLKMIETYRTLLKNPRIKDELKNKIWYKYYYEYSDESKNKAPTLMETGKNGNDLIKNINKTLNDWEKYGYEYFIGNPEDRFT